MTHLHRIAIISLAGLLGAGSTGGAAPRGEKQASVSSRAQYRIDAKRSRFIVETRTSGLSSMFAHDHTLEVGDFSGTANFAPRAPSAAFLELTLKSASLHLTGETNVGERQAIESALRQEVLDTAKYPDISFKSRAVRSERRGDGTYDLRLTGELSLHGVRKTVTIPARAALLDGTLRAIGSFDIRQSDFNITPFSFVSGTVAIKDDVTISFDITASPL